MAKKLVRKTDELNVLTDILTSLTKRAAAQLQTGHDTTGRPVTQRDFAIVNNARAAIKRRRQPPDK
jgi:predicted ATPase